jgi:hypothetical protein
MAASVGKSRAAARSEAGAPLSWTSERADTHFVCEASEEGSGYQAPDSASGASNPKRSQRRRSFLCLIARYRSLRIALGKPPTCMDPWDVGGVWL